MKPGDVEKQEREISRMNNETLDKELGFAEGFAPPTTPSEASWLAALRNERKNRREDPDLS